MSELIVESKPKSYVSEAYRTLKTNIKFSSFDKNIKKIIVTSSESSEGKSTVASNLALALAESDKPVILIDCDLRKPTIDKKFQISNKLGLTDLLVEDLKLSDVMVQYKKNLCIIPSGKIPSNPAEILCSDKMENFLKSLESMFEYIILDTPPVIGATDAQVLSTMSDGVLIVSAFNETSTEVLIKSKELLESVNANILGVILNKAEIKSNKKN